MGGSYRHETDIDKKDHAWEYAEGKVAHFAKFVSLT